MFKCLVAPTPITVHTYKSTERVKVKKKKTIKKNSIIHKVFNEKKSDNLLYYQIIQKHLPTINILFRGTVNHFRFRRERVINRVHRYNQR